MTTTSLRVLAGAVAAIVAVLTAVTVGLVSAPRTCQLRTVAVPATSAPAPTAEAGLGGAEPTLGATPAATGAAPATAAEMVCADGGFGGGAATIALLGIVVVALAVLTLATAGRRRAEVVRPPAVPVGRATAPGRVHDDRVHDDRVGADRAALVQAAIYVRDRTTSKALADRLGSALREAGVTALEPAGEVFDPARHEAGGSTPSPDAAQVGQIASVEVPGYADRGGRVLRAPVVTVYQPSPPGTPPPSPPSQQGARP